MASVRLTRLAGRSGNISTVRLVSLTGKTVSSNTVRLTSLIGRTTAQQTVTVDVGPDLTLEPLEWVQITATGSTFVVWSITQTSGPTQVLVNEGSTWSYRTPGTLNGTILSFTVTGVAQGATGGGDAERSALLNVLNTSATSPVRAAYLGSSTTAGNNASDAAHRYVNLLSDQIRAAKGAAGTTIALDSSATPTTPGFHARNGGIGGATAANYVPATKHAQLVIFQPQICIHMIGSNDYGFNVNPTTYKANVETVLNDIDAEITGPVQHVLINSYQRMDVTGSFSYALYGQQLAAIAAARNNVTYVDLNPYYVAQGIPGTDPNNLIDTDNLHQNNAGHAFMADRLFNEIVATPLTEGVGSDSVTHTIRAHGGFWSPSIGSTIRARGITRYDDLPVS